MSEPLALKALKLPSMLGNLFARIYIRVVFAPSIILFKLSHKMLFRYEREPKEFKMNMLGHRLLRGLMSMLITITFFAAASIPLFIMNMWVYGIKSSPLVKFVIMKVMRLKTEENLGDIVNTDKANLSLGSKILIYGACLLVIGFMIDRMVRKFGFGISLGQRKFRMVLIFIFAGHAILDIITLILYFLTFPMKSMLKNEIYDNRKQYLMHYQIMPNFLNLVYLLPIILATVFKPIGKKINFRKNEEFDQLDPYENSLDILWMTSVFTYDCFCLVQLGIFHAILVRNNLVEPWIIFRCKALRMSLGKRVTFYLKSIVLCLMYFKKDQYLRKQELNKKIQESELLPHDAVNSISEGIFHFFIKIGILMDIRRAAAISIARRKALSIIGETGQRKYNSLYAYLVKESFNLTLTEREQQYLEGKKETDKKEVILDNESSKPKNKKKDIATHIEEKRKILFYEISKDVNKTDVNRFSEARKLWKQINASVIIFSDEFNSKEVINSKDLDEDLAIFEEDLWEDVKVNSLVALACILNPFTGFSFIFKLINIDFTNMKELDKFNDEVWEVYPYIFFDIIGLIMFLILTPINFLIGNFKSTISLLKHFFTSAEMTSDVTQLEKSTYLFGNIWRCVFFYISSIYRTLKYYLILPIAVFCQEELKQYNEFRNAFWYDTATYSKVDKNTFGVFLSMFWAKFALFRRRANKSEKETIGQILEMCNAEKWNENLVHQWYFAEKESSQHPGQQPVLTQDEEDGDIELENNEDPPANQNNFFRRRRRCRCICFEKRFWVLVWEWISIPFRWTWKGACNIVKGLKDFKKIMDEENEKIKTDFQEEMLLTWKANDRGYKFARYCAFDVYRAKAASLSQYASMLKYEKWLAMMDTDQPNETKALERPKLIKTDEGIIEHRNIEAFLNYLILRQKKVNANILKIKELILSSFIKFLSLTLLWRAIDMKAYFNSTLIMELFQEPRADEPAKPKLMVVYMKIYKICFINLVLDMAYWWVVVLILRMDSSLWNLCDRKLKEAQFTTITENSGQTTLNTKLTNLEAVYQYDSKKRALIREYSGYSLNERLEKILFILGKIFVYRAEMIEKISNLKRIPQYQNIDNRTANLLIIKILGRDLLLYCLMGLSFFFNPLRIASFYYFVRNGIFKDKINPEIYFNRFQSYDIIKKDANERINKIIRNLFSCIKLDLKIILKACLLFIFPIRLLQLSKVYLNIRLKLRNKKNKNDNIFCDKEFGEEMNKYMNEVLQELKKDGSSAFAILIILMGVFHVKNTWRRVKYLIYYHLKQTALYQWVQTLKRRSKEEHFEALGILPILIKFKLYEKEKKPDSDTSNRIVLHEIGWMNMIELGEYLTTKDKLNLCMVNKATRDFYLNNSVLWLRFYKKNIVSDVTQIESFSTISYQCIAYARKILAEQNMSKERDFKLGLRYILKEQAIRSIISLPDLVSTPYKLFANGVEKCGVTFVPPRETITQHRTNAEEVERLVAVHRPIMRENLRNRGIFKCYPKYAVTFKPHFDPISGNVNETVTKIDRIRGFLYLEKFFYKLVLFLATLNAIARRPFFHPLYNDMPFDAFQINNLFVASWNCIKATLQLLYCALLGYALWKYIYILMYTFDYDFLSALAGPFLLHPILGYHLLKEVRITDPYKGTNFNLRRIMKCYGVWIYCIGNWSILPVLRAIRTILKYILNHGIVNSIKAIKSGILFGLRIYELSLVIPTQILVRKGVILELVHLLYTLVWILWPLAFVWGYLSLGTNFRIMASLAHLKFIFNNPATNFIKKVLYKYVGSKCLIVWNFISQEALDAYTFIVGNWFILSFIKFFTFIKKIWVLGHAVRLVIWIIGKLFNGIWGGLSSFFGIKLLVMWLLNFMMRSGSEAEGIESTGGSLLPKVTLSIIILTFKITRAIKIIKKIESKLKKRA